MDFAVLRSPSEAGHNARDVSPDGDGGHCALSLLRRSVRTHEPADCADRYRTSRAIRYGVRLGTSARSVGASGRVLRLPFRVIAITIATSRGVGVAFTEGLAHTVAGAI
jgi:hypothetical protein